MSRSPRELVNIEKLPNLLGVKVRIIHMEQSYEGEVHLVTDKDVVLRGEKLFTFYTVDRRSFSPRNTIILKLT